MNKNLTIFFKSIIVCIGIGALVFLLWEPHLEGRNAHASVTQIYFHDPFLVYAYVASIPFFVILTQTFKVFGYGEQKRIVSPEILKVALRTIKYCAFLMIGFVIGGEIFILLNTSDDRAGGVFMGILITLGSIIMALAAVNFERKLLINPD